MASEAKSDAGAGQTITPHIAVKGAAEAIEFYVRALGAVEVCRVPCPQTGLVMHAELRIGDSKLYLCDEFPDYGSSGPLTIGGSPVVLHLSVPDVDAAYERAVREGATAVMPPTDVFWGDRYGKLTDPFGHKWSLATKIEDVTPEQIQERMARWSSSDDSAAA